MSARALVIALLLIGSLAGLGLTSCGLFDTSEPAPRDDDLGQGDRPAASSGFSSWTAIVVSGDHRGQVGEHIAAFNNARRDVRKAIEKLGFSPDHIAEFASGPDADPAQGPPLASKAAIDRKLAQLGTAAPGGCLLYFTSHGSPQGMLLGEEVMTPLMLWKIVTFNCDRRPSIVIVSACYSGIFVTPDIATETRMVLTAASHKTTSFGCGASFKYPLFDQCFIESASLVRDFIALAERTRGCVSALEVQGRLPPSQPQLAIGQRIVPLLTRMRFQLGQDPAAEPVGPSSW